MKAKVISQNQRNGKPALTTINGKPVKLGDVVECDENTLRNLAKKGIVEPADKEAQDVDLEQPSRLTQAGARSNIVAIEAAREDQRAKDDAESAKQKRRAA